MIYVTSIIVTPKKHELNVGDKYDLKAEVCPSNATCKSVHWRSLDPDIAYVSATSGRVHARKEGTTYIYADAVDGSGVYGYMRVKVNQPVTEITVTSEKNTINVGETITLNANISPSNATNQNIKWESSETSIATVNGGTGVVTGVSGGTTTISAIAQDGSGVVGTYTVSVTHITSLKELRVNSIDGGNVPIRRQPTENSAIEVYIANHTIVDLIEAEPQNTKWYNICWHNPSGSDVTGWCSGEYLDERITFVRSISDVNYTVRSGPGKNYAILGKVSYGTRVQLIEQNVDGKNWNKIMYNNITGYIVSDEQLEIIPGWVPLVSYKVADTLTPNQIDNIISNINNSSNISESKKDGVVAIARVLLENHYEPTFVAGILANIEREGNIGEFEISNYVSHPDQKPDYLAYMDEYYSYTNFYLNNYSGKNITEVNLLEVYDILNDLKTKSNNTWEINGSRVGFGLGCIQWTFGRTHTLVEKYLSFNGQKSDITRSQAIQAEAEMVVYDLNISEHNDVIDYWRNQFDNQFDLPNVAYWAGYVLCTHFVVPKDTKNQSMQRASLAQTIYLDMIV